MFILVASSWQVEFLQDYLLSGYTQSKESLKILTPKLPIMLQITQFMCKMATPIFGPLRNLRSSKYMVCWIF